MRSHMWLVALLVLSVVCAQHALGQTPVLVAGGSFTTAGGVSVNRVAQWDGTNWSTLGSGMDNAVSALTVFNNQLVAGGAFTTAGSISASRIAQWDGLTWSAFSNSELMDGSVYALTVFNAMLVIGGAFTTAGGISANYIAQWNGTGWAALGNGIGGGCPRPQCLPQQAGGGWWFHNGGRRLRQLHSTMGWSGMVSVWQRREQHSIRPHYL